MPKPKEKITSDQIPDGLITSRMLAPEISIPTAKAVRVSLLAGRPARITFPGTHVIVPDFKIECYAIVNNMVDYNDRRPYELSSVDKDGLTILVYDINCAMTLTVTRIEGNGITSQYVEYSV